METPKVIQNGTTITSCKVEKVSGDLSHVEVITWINQKPASHLDKHVFGFQQLFGKKASEFAKSASNTFQYEGEVQTTFSTQFNVSNEDLQKFEKEVSGIE